MATPHGPVAIEQLHTGDQVLAENPKSGTVEAEPVVAVIHDPVSTLMAITLSDGSTVRVTTNHPFWVDRAADYQGSGWLQAGQLAIGDQIRTMSGTDAVKKREIKATTRRET